MPHLPGAALQHHGNRNKPRFVTIASENGSVYSFLEFGNEKPRSREVYRPGERRSVFLGGGGTADYFSSIRQRLSVTTLTHNLASSPEIWYQPFPRQHAQLA